MSKLAGSKSLSTPGIPASRAKLVLSASTFANARADLCFAKLVDTSVWRDWNHLVPEVTIRTQPSQDEWETPFASRNPSIESTRVIPLHNEASPRIGRISDVGFSRDASLDIPANSLPTSNQSSSPPLGSKVGTGNHLPVRDPLEGRRDQSPSSQRARVLSVTTIAGEPSIRLRRGTSMTFHVVLEPSKPNEIRKTELVVSELIKPGDQLPGQTPVYRIMWESNTGLAFPHSLPKYLLFCQRVTEIRPIVHGDGKESCEIKTWECQTGLLATFVKRNYGQYLQSMFEQNVHGLRGYCEAMGGAVDRRDFSISAEM